MQASGKVGGNRSAPKTDKAVVTLSLIAFLGCCAGWLWLAIGSDGTGWDFTGFYLAGQVPLSSLYDQEVFQETGRRLLAPIGIDYYPPYVRPAVFAIPLRLFTFLPYWNAYWVFAALQFVFYVAAIYLLWKQFRFPVELVVGFGFFYPGMMSIVTGHDPNVEALLATVGLLLLLSKKPAAAGLVLSLALYKFNLVFLIPLMLLIKKQYRAFAYMAGGGIALALASALLVSPTAYLELLPNIPKYTAGYEPAKTMIGFRSLAYWLGAPNLYYPLAFTGVAFCLFAIRKAPAYRSLLHCTRGLDVVRLSCRLVRRCVPHRSDDRRAGKKLETRGFHLRTPTVPVSRLASLARGRLNPTPCACHHDRTPLGMDPWEKLGGNNRRLRGLSRT